MKLVFFYKLRRTEEKQMHEQYQIAAHSVSCKNKTKNLLIIFSDGF